MTIIYRARGKVTKVEEKRETVRGYNTIEGKTVVETRSLGWFVILDTLVAVPVGGTEPDIPIGTTVIMTLET